LYEVKFPTGTNNMQQTGTFHQIPQI